MIDKRQVADLLQRLRAKWEYGNVHFDIQDIKKFPRENRHITLNAYVESLGFYSLEDKWLTIAAIEAFQIMAGGVYLDMLSNSERMTLREAAVFALEIMEMLPQDTYYYTHPAIYTRQMNSPLTNALFDAGIAFMTTEQIGIFWVEDDD